MIASFNIPDDFTSEALETEQPRSLAKPFNPYSYLLSFLTLTPLQISKNSLTVSFQREVEGLYFPNYSY